MPLSRNIKITLAYDGSGFMGWQVQDDVRTVQGVLEECLNKLLGDAERVIAAGRTDAGVHAFGQVVNVRTAATIPAPALKRALNGSLPKDISIIYVEDVSDDFHARYMAKSKQYVYIIDTSALRSPLLAHYVLQVDYHLDISAMQQAARYIIGKHDFAAFMGVGSPTKTTRRQISVSEVIGRGSRIYYYIEGSGFLRHMVRNIVGTLLVVGRKDMAPGDMLRIIACSDRAKAGPTAPPQGLYLVGVNY